MDLLAHGLIGAASGLAVLSVVRKNPTLHERRLAAMSGILGGEAPDSDIAIVCWFEHSWKDSGGLAYMLYHRGITHSVLACFLLAPAIALGMAAFPRARALPATQLGLAAFVGALLHLAMDATNDYGVHPFYPVTQRWFYGDFLFLGEPLVSAPFLPFVVSSIGLERRHLLPVCFVFGSIWFGFGIHSEWLSWWGAAIALAWLLAQTLLQRRQMRAGLAWASATLPAVGFFAASRVARARAAESVAALAPAEELSDVVTTPRGANPFCFRVITVSRDGARFHVRLGVTSLLSIVDDSTCFAPPGGAIPASVCLEELPPPPEPSRVRWLAAFEGSDAEFDSWAKYDARVNATSHFLRAPFWGPDARDRNCAGTHTPSSKRMLIGDLRVDYSKNDLTTYCKYSFDPCNPKPFAPIMPLGEPRFLRPSAPVSTSPCPR